MDCYIVLTFLCLLMTQTSCGTVKRRRETRAMDVTIAMMQTDIKNTLELMNDSKVLPNTFCISDLPSLLGENLTLAAQNFSSFGCHLNKIVNQTQVNLRPLLKDIVHVALDVPPRTMCQDCCSVPSFSDDLELHVYVKCLLQTMDQRITKAGDDSS